MATRTTLGPDQGPNFTRITKGDPVATSDGIQLVWNKLLTDAYAFARTEHPNVFHKNQDIQKEIPQLRMLYSQDTLFGRVLMAVAKSFYLTLNADWDGAQWNCEDVTQPLWGVNISDNTDRFSVFRAPAGANPRTGAIAERFGVDAAGAIYERGRSPLALGDWTPYTPQWHSGGAVMTLGNGALNGRYAIWGHTCAFIISGQYGTTTVDPAPGSAWFFTTPFNYSTAIGQFATGNCYIENSGIAGYAGWTPQLSAGTPFFPLLSPGTAAAPSVNLTNANPFAFGTADYFVIQGLFEFV